MCFRIPLAEITGSVHNSADQPTFSESSWAQRSSRSIKQSLSDLSSFVKVVSRSALSDTRRTRSCSKPSIYHLFTVTYDTFHTRNTYTGSGLLEPGQWRQRLSNLGGMD